MDTPQVRVETPPRNIALVLLAILATIFVLDWARAVIIPLLLGLILSYALAPVVDFLERYAVPRALAAAVLLSAIVAGAGATVLSLRDEATGLVETLPAAVQKFQQAARREFAGPEKTIDKVQRAAAEIERATQQAARTETPPGVTRVQVERAAIDIRRYLLTTVTGTLAAAGMVLIVLFLAFFLLASGATFRRKWVRLSGPTLSRKKITVQVMDDIGAQIKRFLAIQVLTSALVGLATGVGFRAIGLENSAVWGVAAGVLNLVPYLGAIVTTAGAALFAFLQFGTAGMALAAGGISFVIHILVGYWLTPWLSSRASRMNSVVVFAGLLFWGWLWGGWGLLLGLPVMMIVKSICDHVEDLRPIGEFMGE